jgi:hypothetical protein
MLLCLFFIIHYKYFSSVILTRMYLNIVSMLIFISFHFIFVKWLLKLQCAPCTFVLSVAFMGMYPKHSINLTSILIHHRNNQPLSEAQQDYKEYHLIKGGKTRPQRKIQINIWSVGKNPTLFRFAKTWWIRIERACKSRSWTLLRMRKSFPACRLRLLLTSSIRVR